MLKVYGMITLFQPKRVRFYTWFNIDSLWW